MGFAKDACYDKLKKVKTSKPKLKLKDLKKLKPNPVVIAKEGLLYYAETLVSEYILGEIAKKGGTVYDQIPVGPGSPYDLCKKAEAKEKPKSDKNKTDGPKIKQRGKVEVKCFDKKSKYDEKEYTRQLDNQQEGLNKMSADEFIRARGAFSGVKCNDDGSVGKDENWKKEDRPKRDRKKADEARDKFRDKRETELRNKGLSGKELTDKLDGEMSNLAALHNPDMIAAGLDMFNLDDVTVSMGDKKINSSVGSSWSSRIGDLDKDACKAKKDKKGDEKMNAKLETCANRKKRLGK